MSVYVLKLENDKYYVGRSGNVKTRMKHHFESDGCEWTKLHKPISVVETIENCDGFDEEKYMLKYMSKYGIDNVRGGSVCQVVLKDTQVQWLQHVLKSTTDCCYKCGKVGHFVNQCTFPDEIKSDEIKSTQNNLFWVSINFIFSRLKNYFGFAVKSQNVEQQEITLESQVENREETTSGQNIVDESEFKFLEELISYIPNSAELTRFKVGSQLWQVSHGSDKYRTLFYEWCEKNNPYFNKNKCMKQYDYNTTVKKNHSPVGALINILKKELGHEEAKKLMKSLNEKYKRI